MAGQSAVSYTYDNANRLTQIVQGPSAVPLTYDAANRRASLTLPNGVVVSYGYDAASQLAGLTYTLGATTLGNLTYAYDNAGRRTSLAGSYARTGLPAALTSATYDAANELTKWGTTALTYDSNGNMASDGTNTYTWDARNHLTLIKAGRTTVGSFQYDPFGRRASRTVSGATTAFLYDGINPVQELSGVTPIANLITGLNVDEIFTRTDAIGARHFLTDALGSTLGLTDSTGTLQTQYTYEPWATMPSGLGSRIRE